jgi:hypothetical protein
MKTELKHMGSKIESLNNSLDGKLNNKFTYIFTNLNVFVYILDKIRLCCNLPNVLKSRSPARGIRLPKGRELLPVPHTVHTRTQLG